MLAGLEIPQTWEHQQSRYLDDWMMCYEVDLAVRFGSHTLNPEALRIQSRQDFTNSVTQC